MSNRSSEVQILHDICTRFGRYLDLRNYSWIIKTKHSVKLSENRDSQITPPLAPRSEQQDVSRSVGHCSSSQPTFPCLALTACESFPFFCT